MFTKRWGGLLNFGLIYKKESKSQEYKSTYNGVIISGNGSGAGMFKLGLGIRYIPYSYKRWNIATDLSYGILNAKAGGGTGNITVYSGSYNFV